MDADVFISLTHFKGHETTGFGGTLKNIGMGCGSRAGKTEQHASGHPEVQESMSCAAAATAARRSAARTPLATTKQGCHRPGQVQGLRPLHRCLQLRRYLCPVRQCQ